MSAPTTAPTLVEQILKLFTDRGAMLNAVCRRLGIDPAKVTQVIRVVLGVEPMPYPVAVAPWQVTSP